MANNALTGAVVVLQQIQKSNTPGKFRLNFKVACESNGICVDAVCESAFPLRTVQYSISTDMIHAARQALTDAGDADGAVRPILMMGAQTWLTSA